MERSNLRSRCIQILENIEQKLKNRFNEIHKTFYNPNVKGANYERILAEFLTEYFGGVYDIHTRVALLDGDLRALEIFSSGENEFDVVATFKTMCPRIVLEIGDMRYVPYDGVAFLVEVKQTLTKRSLEEDLSKLDKVSQLGYYWRECVTAELTGRYKIDRPLRALFYHERRTDDKVLADLLSHYSSWDLLLVLSEDMLLANYETLPLIRACSPRTDRIIRLFPYPLLQFIMTIHASRSFPLYVNTSHVFLKLLSVSSLPPP